MTKEIYNIQRQKLMDDAQKLLDESKTAEAQAKMKEVEALDAKFEEEAKIQANLNALAGQKVAAPAAAAQSVDLSGAEKTPDVLDRYDTDEYKRAFMNYVLTGKKPLAADFYSGMLSEDALRRAENFLKGQAAEPDFFIPERAQAEAKLKFLKLKGELK